MSHRCLNCFKLCCLFPSYENGLFRVGPESAGADPGPACYGRGGDVATVTDANLVLGRLVADRFLGGQMTLDIEAAKRVVQKLASLEQKHIFSSITICSLDV